MLVLQLLQDRGPMTLGQLAAASGVSARTSGRDIAALTAAGIPVRRAGHDGPCSGGRCYEVPAGYHAQLAQASRIAGLARLLQAGARMTGLQIAAALGVSRNTVVRDMDAMRASGMPLDAVPGCRGGYQLPGDFAHLVQGLSTAQMQLLVLAGSRLVSPRDQTLVVSWVYAVHGDLPRAVVDELRRGHDHKVSLAAVAEQHAEKVAAIWAGHEGLAGAIAEVDQAIAEVSELTRLRRETTGRRLAPETQAALRLARRRLTAARAAQRAAKNRVYPELAGVFAAEAEAYDSRLDDLRRAAVAGGLGWDTANEITWQFKKAIRQAALRRSQGLPAMLRPRTEPWDGTGTVTAQIVRLAGEPPRSPAALASPDGRYRAKAVLEPWIEPRTWQAMALRDRRLGKPGILELRVGSGEHARRVTVPAVIHRMLPAEADVARIRITRKRVGTRLRSSIGVVARLPQPPAPAQGHDVVLLSCWRELPDGAIRAAVVGGAGPPPADLLEAGVVRARDGWAEVVSPASWREVSGNIERLNSRRAHGRARLRAWLRYWMEQNPGLAAALDPDGTLAAAIAPESSAFVRGGRLASSSASALAAAAVRLRAAPPAGCGEVVARLHRWWRHDQWLHNWESDERYHLAARRRDAWSKVASWVCSPARLVVLDTLAPRRRRTDEDLTAAQRAAEGNRFVVVPSLLRARVRSAARRRGVPVLVTAAPAGRPQHGCGSPLQPRELMTAPPGPCPACGTNADPDMLVLEQILASHARRAVNFPPETPSARDEAARRVLHRPR